MRIDIRKPTWLLISLFCLAAGSAQAGPIYSWTWSQGGPGTVDNSGGTINWINAEFDGDNQVLSYEVNLGGGSSPDGSGFTLMLSDGFSPKRHEAELAMLYFDASNAFGPTTSSGPDLTVYGYNGKNNVSSYNDGSSALGIQAPDRIASSREASATGWINSLKADQEADGSRTLGFEIQTQSIANHSPLYAPQSAEGWFGTGFGQQLGIWMTTFSEFGTSYQGSYVDAWAYYPGTMGQLSASNLGTRPTDPVPEPATLTLLGLGTLGILGPRWRRRKKT